MGLNQLPHLGSSLLQVLIPNEVQSMWKEEAWQTDVGRSARTLVKYPDLLALDRDVSHDVEAIRQSTFLLILARPDREKEKCHE
jgi:hypothetical protein